MSPMAASDSIVYVVDDDEDVRLATWNLLTSVGQTAEVFGNADDFLAAFDADRVSCVVLDIRMPRRHGLDVQRALTEAGADPPCIFITAHADIGFVVRAMKAGAIQVLAKPFDPEAFIEAVQHGLDEALERRTAREEIRLLRQRFETLTAREREVMSLVVAGRLNRHIATELGTTEKTIKAHRAQVMRKMGAGSLPDLVRTADRLNASGLPARK
jgi:FixJ family two-component response regulator